MDPKKLRVMKALTKHLEINVTSWTPSDADGNDLPAITYALAGRVWRGRTVITATDAEDALSLLEAPRQIDGAPAAEGGIKRNENWVILLQGFPKDDKTNPSDPAYYMMAATEMALSRLVLEDPRGGGPVYPDEYRLGGIIGTITIGQGVVRPASQEVSRLAMFYIPLTINIQTDVSNP